MKKHLLNAAKIFLPLAAVITVLIGLVYLAVQQDFRMSANDPQIQIAEDFADQLSSGVPLGQFNFKFDISKSLATFVVIYNDQGQPVTGSGQLNGQFPALPAGVTDYVKKYGEDRITWQPQSGVRSALVVTHFKNSQSAGYIAVGRSLREIEQRESMLGWYALTAWLAALILSLAVLILVEVFGAYFVVA